MPSFKIYCADEIRRFHHSNFISWCQLRETIKGLFPRLNLNQCVFHYVDVEKDKILVNSQQEWEEAKHCTSDPIHIFITEKIPEEASETSNEQPRKKMESSQFSQLPPPIQRFFEGKKISPENLPDWLRNTKSFKETENGTELDINIGELFNAFHTKGLNEMRNHHYFDARQHFINALSLFPSNRTALYNLGCAEARLGSPQLAIEALEKAIEEGFTDWEEMENDPDFDSIRILSEFQNVLSKIKPLRYRTVNPEPIQEIQFKSNLDGKWNMELIQLKEMGFNFVEKNIQLLEKYNGDISACISEILGGQEHSGGF
jgi:tetratricopeptide (TPR) repeat protein